MASLQDLRGRIKSVKNTQKITKTMKMVAAAKVRKARLRVDSARPYAERLNKVLGNLASASSGGSLLLTGRPKVKTVRIIVFGADRGLCGGFNANVFRKLMEAVGEHSMPDVKLQVVTVGKKVRDNLKFALPDLIYKEYIEVTKNITFELAEEIANQTVADFEAGECDEVHIIYNKCVSMLTQTPTKQQFIPFAPEVGHDTGITAFEYEPEEKEILEDLLPRNLKTQVFTALLESSASEQASRMTAMDNATRNAGEMIDKLSLEYNRSRQAAITSELIEIISGAEAV